MVLRGRSACAPSLGGLGAAALERFWLLMEPFCFVLVCAVVKNEADWSFVFECHLRGAFRQSIYSSIRMPHVWHAICCIAHGMVVITTWRGSECRLFQWLVLARLNNYIWEIQCMKHAT